LSIFQQCKIIYICTEIERWLSWSFCTQPRPQQTHFHPNLASMLLDTTLAGGFLYSLKSIVYVHCSKHRLCRGESHYSPESKTSATGRTLQQRPSTFQDLWLGTLLVDSDRAKHNLGEWHFHYTSDAQLFPPLIWVLCRDIMSLVSLLEYAGPYICSLVVLLACSKRRRA
jgi:hypothetical protein